MLYHQASVYSFTTQTSVLSVAMSLITNGTFIASATGGSSYFCNRGYESLPGSLLIRSKLSETLCGTQEKVVLREASEIFEVGVALAYWGSPNQHIRFSWAEKPLSLGNVICSKVCCCGTRVEWMKRNVHVSWRGCPQDKTRSAMLFPTTYVRRYVLWLPPRLCNSGALRHSVSCSLQYQEIFPPSTIPVSWTLESSPCPGRGSFGQFGNLLNWCSYSKLRMKLIQRSTPHYWGVGFILSYSQYFDLIIGHLVLILVRRLLRP